MSTYEQFRATKNLGSAVGSTDPAVLIAVKDDSGNAATLKLNSSGELLVSDPGGGGGGGGGDATAANQVTGNNSLSSIDTKMTTLAGLVDSVEGLIAATNTALSSVNTALTGLGTNTDGLETLIAATNTALGTINSALTALQGYTDGLETLIGTSNTGLTTIHTDLATTLAGLMATLNGYVDQLEGYTDGIEALITSTNTKLDQIHTDLAAGFTLASQGYAQSATVPRSGDTAVYLANDVIGINTSTGGAVLTFTNMGPAAGGQIMITSVEIEVDSGAIISGESSYSLALYSATPPSALADNAAWDLTVGDRASYLGQISLGTPSDLGSTLYAETYRVDKQITCPVGGTLYGYLITVGGYVPTSGRVYVVKLHSVAL
jgi:hypothetical protein